MPSILIIDDEADVRDGMRRVLARAGHVVRSLGDPSEAVAELRRLPTDLVITDIIMPKMNGVEVVQSILREFPAMRILVISGGGNFDTGPRGTGEILTTTYLTEAMAAGAHRALKKPFDSAELLQTVELTLSAEKR